MSYVEFWIFDVLASIDAYGDRLTECCGSHAEDVRRVEGRCNAENRWCALLLKVEGQTRSGDATWTA